MAENRKKITREFCQYKELRFKPKTQAEAVFIQRQLLAMGFGWEDEGRVIVDPAICVWRGIALSRCQITQFPKGRGETIECSVEDFSEVFDEDDVRNMWGHEQVIEVFNRLSARMDALAEQQAEILAELRPKTLDKGGLKKPASKGKSI